MRSTDEKQHLQQRVGDTWTPERAACGETLPWHRLWQHPVFVTCRRCKRTRQYARATRLPPAVDADDACRAPVLPCPLPGHADWPCDYARTGTPCAGQITDRYLEYPGDSVRLHVCEAHYPLWDAET